MDLFNINKRRVKTKVLKLKENFKNHEFLNRYAQSEIVNFLSRIKKASSVLGDHKKSTNIVWTIRVNNCGISVSGLMHSQESFFNSGIDFCSQYNMEKLKYYWEAAALAEYLGDLILEGLKKALKKKEIHDCEMEVHSTPYGCGIKVNDLLSEDSSASLVINCALTNPNFIAPKKW